MAEGQNYQTQTFYWLRSQKPGPQSFLSGRRSLRPDGFVGCLDEDCVEISPCCPDLEVQHLQALPRPIQYHLCPCISSSKMYSRPLSGSQAVRVLSRPSTIAFCDHQVSEIDLWIMLPRLDSETN